MFDPLFRYPYKVNTITETLVMDLIKSKIIMADDLALEMAYKIDEKALIAKKKLR
jgi:hypothetical protein